MSDCKHKDKNFCVLRGSEVNAVILTTMLMKFHYDNFLFCKEICKYYELKEEIKESELPSFSIAGMVDSDVLSYEKQRYRLSSKPEDIKDLPYETDRYGAHYIELTEDEKQDLFDKGYYLEDYKITP